MRTLISNSRAIEFKGAAGDVAKALDADLYLNRNNLPSIGTVGKVIGDGAVPPLPGDEPVDPSAAPQATARFAYVTLAGRTEAPVMRRQREMLAVWESEMIAMRDVSLSAQAETAHA